MPERFSPEYLAHLASDAWRHKREQAFKEHGAYCQRCFETGRLDVHHLSYKNLGNERMQELMPLCHPCHEELHERQRESNIDLWHFSMMFVDSPLTSGAKTRSKPAREPYGPLASQLERQPVRHAARRADLPSEAFPFQSPAGKGKHIGVLHRKPSSKRRKPKRSRSPAGPVFALAVIAVWVWGGLLVTLAMR